MTTPTKSLLRRAPGLLVASVLLAVVSLLGPLTAPAHADAVSDKKAQARRIADQIDDQGSKISQLSEQLDDAVLHAQQVDGDVAAAKVALASLDAEAAGARSRLKDQAILAYTEGGPAAKIKAARVDPGADGLLVRQYQASLAATQVDALDQMRAFTLRLRDEQHALSVAQRDAAASVGKVRSTQAAAAKADAAQQALLASVQGDLATLVQQAQDAKDAEAQAAYDAAVAGRSGKQSASRSRTAAGDTGGTGDGTPTIAPVRTPVVPVVGAPPATTPTTRPPVARTPGTTPTTKPPAVDGPDPAPPRSGAEAAVAEARRQLGKPYQYGASGPGSFDCSGLTAWAWRAGGVGLPHSSQAQYSATRHVNPADAQPGDLFFFGHPIHHVGIYIGGGSMIAAPETGKNVQIQGAYRSDLVGVGRP